jgi:hypothetical protein
MSFCVVSPQAFICRHGVSCRRHVGDTSLVMSRTQENDVSAIMWLLFELKHKKLLVAKVLVRLGWLELVACYWYELGMSGLFFHVLCRGDMSFLEKLADIWRCRRHFGDMSATFPAKLVGAGVTVAVGCMIDNPHTLHTHSRSSLNICKVFQNLTLLLKVIRKQPQM